MVDSIVQRKDMKEMLGRLVALLGPADRAAAARA
jgi:acetyl-CoA carboxylase beta subunit